MIALKRWGPLIDSADSEAELLQAMQSYSAAWLPSHSAQLPPECAIHLPTLVDDIPAMALTFKRAELMSAGPEEARNLLGELAAVFAAASERLRVLRSHMPLRTWKPLVSRYPQTKT